MVLEGLALGGGLIWLIILVLPWRPWSTRERLRGLGPGAAARLDDMAVLIPVRDEAQLIARTLGALAGQGAGLEVILIDDQSSDGTAETARATRLPGLQIVRAPPLPDGWSGKLWALEHGRRRATREFLLLLDGDIELGPGLARALRARLLGADLALVSVMAELHMEGFWGKLLNPAFVYFFKLLYPFGLANRATSPVAAAAGGCLLLRSDALREIGGFGALKGALIDDCSLAKRVKEGAGAIWIGLSRDVRSLRGGGQLAAIGRTVARTAYPQLRYSPAWLLVCTLLMVAAFAGPLAGLLWGSSPARALSVLALAAMGATYVPTLRYYDRSAAWALLLPAVGSLYLLMTWHSAIAHWRGRGSPWKGRTYARPPLA